MVSLFIFGPISASTPPQLAYNFAQVTRKLI